MKNLLVNYLWNTSPTAYISVAYESKRDGALMCYRFSWTVKLGYASSYYYNALDLVFTIGARSVSSHVKDYNKGETGWSYSGTTSWLNVESIEDLSLAGTIELVDLNNKTIKMTKSVNLETLPYPFQIGTIGEFDVDDGVVVPYTVTYKYADAQLKIMCDGTVIKPLAAYSGGKVVFTDAEKETIYEVMKNANEKTFNFYLYTYMSGTEYGYTYTTATGKIYNAMPYFEENAVVGVYDTDETVANVTNNDVLVQGKSNVWVNIPIATAKKKATIVSYDIEVGSQKVNVKTSGDNRFGAINEVGGLPLVVTAIDTRGNKATISTDIVVCEYKDHTIATTLYRKNNYEEETHIIVEVGYSTIDGLNEITSLTCDFAKVGESFGTPTMLESGTETILLCDKNFAYNFRIIATDKLGISKTVEYVLPKGKFPLFIDTRMNAVGINAFPLDETEALRVADGIAVFEDGIAFKSSTDGSSKYFLLSVNDSGQLSITEIGEKRK